MKPSFFENLKLYAKAFNTLGVREQLFLTLGVIFFLFVSLKLASGAIDEVGLQIEASNYGVSSNELMKLKLVASARGMSIDALQLEIKKSKSLGFDSFEDYTTSKKYGEITFEQYSFIKKYERTVEEWTQDKAILKSSGQSLQQYTLQVTEQKKKLDEENKTEAKKFAQDQAEKREWQYRCVRFAESLNQCAVAASIPKCMEIKMGTFDNEMAKIYCDGDKPNWTRMGKVGW